MYPGAARTWRRPEYSLLLDQIVELPGAIGPHAADVASSGGDDRRRDGEVVCCHHHVAIGALDLARAAPEGLVGAVSLHGVFTPNPLPANPISAKVLVLHGWDDPLATPDTVLALATELTKAGADWQIHAYGQTLHAFTTPGANTPGRAMYSPDADERRELLKAGRPNQDAFLLLALALEARARSLGRLQDETQRSPPARRCPGRARPDRTSVLVL